MILKKSLKVAEKTEARKHFNTFFKVNEYSKATSQEHEY